MPIGAVVEGNGDRASVYIVDGDRAKRRPVRVAFIGPEAVALDDGVKPGERVVTDGALYLQDDERIEIVTEGDNSVVGSLGVGPDPDEAEAPRASPREVSLSLLDVPDRAAIRSR